MSDKKRDPYNLGKSFMFPPEVINDIHIKSELGRYRMRGFSLFKKIPTWDDLTFMPGTLTRFVIEGYREKCLTKTIIGPEAKRPLELDIPIYVTGMSFGALSYEAKTALARGATMAGTATCSGEGGMIPDERRYSEKWFYQCIQSRYGFNPQHLRLADGCEFFIGQGCKVGLGGHLMGQKVTDQVAEMRSLPAGIDQRSPARHPDWLGPDDLALKIEEIREATNWEIPIQLKLGEMATRVRAAELLTEDASRAYDAGERCDMEAGMAKYFSSEAAMENASEAMRIHGAYGYSPENVVERYYRDAPLLVVGEGTNELQRIIIARQLLERNPV